MKRNKFYATEQEIKEFDLISELVKSSKIVCVKFDIEQLFDNLKTMYSDFPIFINFGIEYSMNINFGSNNEITYRTKNRRYFQEMALRVDDKLKGVKY